MTFSAKLSLVTGASSGIGASFARALAARGSDLVLVARRADQLRALADELTARHGVRCQVVALDLSQEHAGSTLLSQVRGDLDLVINNAGFAVQGGFLICRLRFSTATTWRGSGAKRSAMP